MVTRNGIGKLRYIFLIQAIILGLFFVSSNSIIAGLLNISFIALIVYIMNSTMQLYFIDLADRHYPSAKNLAVSLTPVSVNIGIAIGSALGGFVTTNMRLVDVSWVGGIIAISAALLTFISYHFDQKASTQIT
ncbi:hypothetical protein [Lysinibacillus sp. NPDC047702]|uniref:hypothetical protein n=1 Tax=unclassified Lysinibacillus TaxID=2636778 RepID=UPI003D05548A